MITVSAQLPRDGGEDRVFTTDQAVIVLDGASAFRPVPVSPEAYVDSLGTMLMAQMGSDNDLRTILGHAISATARELSLTPGESPSSTVAITRQSNDQVEFLVLGDSLIALPERVIMDDRLDRVSSSQRERYRKRLRDGHGYDQAHRDILKELQAEQAARRNRSGGYWIAEAEPVAAEHAIVGSRPLPSAPWAILATDGAYKPMKHLGLADWPNLHTYSSKELARLIEKCERWEKEEDPQGVEFPRAKRHDDKTLAVATFLR